MKIDPESKTAGNLKTALAGEAKANVRYLQFARRARHDGQEAIADAFEKAAGNEREHANLWIKVLEMVGSSEENLESAIAGEHDESSEMYPQFARDAIAEGYKSTAWLFEQIAAIEKRHEALFHELLSELRSAKIERNAVVTVCICERCGYKLGAEKENTCPLCNHMIG